MVKISIRANTQMNATLWLPPQPIESQTGFASTGQPVPVSTGRLKAGRQALYAARKTSPVGVVMGVLRPVGVNVPRSGSIANWTMESPFWFTA